MANAPSIASADVTFVSVFGDYIVRFFLITMPVFAVLGVIAFATNVAQIGFKITPKAMEPKFDKLNLVNGFKRLFALRSLVDMIKNVLKVAIIGYVAYKTIQGEFDSFFLLPNMTIPELAGVMGKLSLVLGVKIGAVVFVIAVLDYMYQRYEFEKSIRMSRQEVKEEHKETEGSPQLKARVRQVQREMSRKRMMQAVPTADVVLTNPTHLAVALKYDPEEMSAPYVVAKGARLIAQRIKELAHKHDIPVIEDKPLARALFKACDVGDLVPANLYRAVAEVLAYVYRLKGKAVS
jgi:flagellar biosynthetic protein FlhB